MELRLAVQRGVFELEPLALEHALLHALHISQIDDGGKFAPLLQNNGDVNLRLGVFACAHAARKSMEIVRLRRRRCHPRANDQGQICGGRTPHAPLACAACRSQIDANA